MRLPNEVVMSHIQASNMSAAFLQLPVAAGYKVDESDEMAPNNRKTTKQK